MAVQSLWMQEVDFPARWDRSLFDNLWAEGVLGDDAFVVAESSPTAMTVEVDAGVAVVTGDDQAFQGKYFVREEAGTTVNISAAPGSGQRNDLVVIRIRDTDAGGPAGDDAIIDVIAGTPSGSPVDPTLPASCLALARVRVPSGTTAITDSLIDDLRNPAQSTHTGLAVPPGTIADTVRTTPPYGWALLDGSTLTNAQTAYPALWAVMPSSFKSGSDIVLPDSRGRVLVGRGSSPFGTIGATGGAETHTLIEAEMPSHTHTQDSHNHTQNAHSHTINHGHSLSDPGHTHSELFRVFFSFGPSSQIAQTGLSNIGTLNFGYNATTGITIANHSGSTTAPDIAAVNQAQTATNQNTGSGSAHNNLMPYFVVNRMIRLL